MTQYKTPRNIGRYMKIALLCILLLVRAEMTLWLWSGSEAASRKVVPDAALGFLGVPGQQRQCSSGETMSVKRAITGHKLQGIKKQYVTAMLFYVNSDYSQR